MPSSNLCSLVILTYNSALTLEVCIQSAVTLASEIIIVDNFSTDSTLEIAKKYGARIFQRQLENFGIQKQFAISQANNDWIFLLDSDEEASPQLLQQVKTILLSPDDKAAYRITRKNFYLGSYLRFGGKYPDYQTRLFNKNFCRYSEDILHEKVIVQGPLGTLHNPILHSSYPNLETWFKKLELFARKNGERLSQQGVRPSFFNSLYFCFLKPCGRFIRRYGLKGGFLDGMPGFLACIHDALTEILSYFFLTQTVKK